jgi:membrane protein insertase Oxa1/YidC/SpoIIIJ
MSLFWIVLAVASVFVVTKLSSSTADAEQSKITWIVAAVFVIFIAALLLGAY